MTGKRRLMPGAPFVPAAALGKGGGVLNSWSPLKKKILAGAADVTILMLGDSRGNATDETLYEFAVDLGLDHLTHTVDYYLVNQTTPTSYDAASTIQTGSGARTIKVYNASYVGTTPIYFLGDKMAAIISAISPDLILWNYGANMSNSGTEASEFLMGLDPVRLAKPNANHVCIVPYPFRDDTVMEGRVPSYLDLFSRYGDIARPDYYTAMIAAGKPSGYYADNVHGNAAGNTFLRPILINAYRAARAADYAPVAAGLAVNGTNLLSDGHFDNALDSGDAGSAWDYFSSPTVAVESTIKPSDATRSMKLTGTTGGARLQQALSAGNLTLAKAAGYVVFGAKLYVPAGSASSVGRIAVTQSGTGAVSRTQRSGAISANDGWVWSFIEIPVASTITGMTAVLYCDSAANASSTVYYETAIMVEGRLPKDLA